MKRPLARLGIDELEAQFETSKHDLPTVKRLIGELAYRKVPRATTLLDKAQKILRSVESKRKESVTGALPPRDTRDLAGTPTPTQSGFEFEVPVFASMELNNRPLKATTVAAALQPVPVVLPIFLAASASAPEPVAISMSVEQAYRVLKATSASSWDAIEFSRRQVVARAQPDTAATLEPSKRQALLDEACEANIAYKVLLQARS